MALIAVIENDRTNAVIAWIVVGALAVAAAASTVFGEPVWTVLAGSAIAIALVPAVAFRESTVMPPWEVLVLVAVPAASRFFALSDILADTATFVGIIGLAVLIVVELHVFSPMEIPPRFGAVLVVLITMATAGLWTLVQFASDTVLGTALIEGQTALMWDMVIATAVSVLAGPFFVYYFERQAGEGGRSFRAQSTADGSGGDP